MGSNKSIKEPDFCSVFSRLKEQLGIKYDREMAELLGTNENAYNTRKEEMLSQWINCYFFVKNEL